MNYRDVYRQPTITDKQYVMRFGKHKNRTIEYILDVEPWYISWLAENTDMDFDHKIMTEAEGDLRDDHSSDRYPRARYEADILDTY